MTYDFAKQNAVAQQYMHIYPRIAKAYWGDRYLGFTPTEESYNSLQKLGIDAYVHTTTGIYTIDYKVDVYTSERMVIEMTSNTTTGKPGWALNKSLLNDYIMYYMPQRKEAYMLPRAELQEQVEKHYEEWGDFARRQVKGFGIAHTQNTTYTTLSWLVPIKTIQETLGRKILLRQVKQ